MSERPSVNDQFHVHTLYRADRVTVVPTSPKVPADEVNVQFDNGSVGTVKVSWLCSCQGTT